MSVTIVRVVRALLALTDRETRRNICVNSTLSLFYFTIPRALKIARYTKIARRENEIIRVKAPFELYVGARQ